MTGLFLALALTVTGIVDGDTFKADGVNHRLFGVNAPERDDPRGPAATRAPIYRWILGTAHPPVMLTVGEVPVI